MKVGEDIGVGIQRELGISYDSCLCSDFTHSIYSETMDKLYFSVIINNWIFFSNNDIFWS